MDAEELNLEDRTSTERYLVAEGHARPGEMTEHEILAGGVSGRTVRVAFADGREWVLKQALAKLRVQADWFSDPRRIHREALGMKVLAELAPPGSITKLIFDDERYHVIGMEAVPRPHQNWKTMLLRGDRGDVVVEHFYMFARLLADIHGGSAVLNRGWDRAFDDRSFFESLRIEPYYAYSARHAPQAHDFLHQLMHDTREQRLSLVHGDFSPKNVLVFQNRLVLLDHEVIHWGDPAFDVGFAMSHLLTKGYWNEWIRHYTEYFVDSYEIQCGNYDVDGMHFPKYRQRCVRHTLGCLLARVIGRSPLEYLNDDARRHQCNAVLRIISNVPDELPSLIKRFYQEMNG